jgi:hypothetical protein
VTGWDARVDTDQVQPLVVAERVSAPRQRRWRRRLVCGLIFSGLFATAAGSVAARARIFRIQLDGDGPRERVLIQKRECKVYARGCSRLIVRDGQRDAVLTQFTQRPRYPYGWRVRTVRFLDLTGDGRAEILWSLVTAGATGSSPSLRGADQWNGRRASRIFKFSNGRKPPAGYVAVVFVKSRVVSSESGLPEIETREFLLDEDDATCCPSAYRQVRHRWNGERIAPVPGSTRIEPL